MQKQIIKAFEESIILRQMLLQDKNFLKEIENIIEIIKVCFKNNKKLIIAGNGGSAADSMHFAAEFVGHFKKERRGLPAIALSSDNAVASAIANDYSFEDIFARQIEALGQTGDVFIGFSTSGKSKNLINAMKKANDMKLTTICFLGGDGGVVKNIAKNIVIVPSKNTPRVQEIHTLLLHIISEEAERNF